MAGMACKLSKWSTSIAVSAIFGCIILIAVLHSELETSLVTKNDDISHEENGMDDSIKIRQQLNEEWLKSIEDMDYHNKDSHGPAFGRPTVAFGQPGNFMIDHKHQFRNPKKVKVHRKQNNYGDHVGERSGSPAVIEYPRSIDPFETQFKFGSYFSDNMVLQREPHRNLIWGYSPSLMVGQKVGVEVSNRLKEYVTVVQMGGRWEVLIDPHLSTGPHDISASLGSNVIWLRGVLFGDIWLCAGSSVLASPIHEAEYVANNWDMSDVRTLTIPDRTSQKFVDKGSSDHDSWHVPSKHSLSKFSAACWAFGLRLQQRLGRPVGLIQATSADSTIESWLPDGLSDNCNRNLSTRENSPKRSSLFNGMLQPYLKMSIGGILWYHGENDNTAPNLYTCYLRHLVSDFDKFWNNGVQQGTLLRPHQTPWAIVQLGATVDKPAFNAGDLRWAQTAGKGFLPNEYLPNTFMAVTVDISQVTNGSVIVDVGTLSKRLVSSALNFVYPVDGRLPGPSVQAEGPRPFDIKVMDDTIIVHYHLDREQHSLEIRTISGFEACCIRDEKTSCQRYPSNIVSNALTSVALSNPCITKNQTSALRYLWSPSPCKLMACPIYSRDSNLPASPWIWDFHSVANFR